MVSYIFANKTKNILVMVFASLLSLNHLYEIAAYIGESSAFPFYKTLSLLPLVSFILVGGFEYLASVPEGYQAISYPVLIECFVWALYYFSLFSLTLNKNE